MHCFTTQYFTMCYVFIVIFLLILCARSINIDDPTPEEIAKGFVVKPWNSWGQQAREQNSLRILCIGGSNTANRYPGGSGYVDLLDEFVKTKLTTDEYFNNHSYAWNRGVSGMSIFDFTGRLYNFELDTSVTEWPNVIIIDGSVNIYSNITTIIPGLERLIRSIAFKYQLKGFHCPDFMFYNMPHLKTIYEIGKLKKKTERERYVASYRKKKSIFEADEFIKRFATFYHFPVISWGEATYDAAMRHFIEEGSFEAPHTWPYSVDGIHMSATGGTKFGMDKLLGPFFQGIVKPRAESVLKDVSQWPRLYAAGPALIEILSFTSYYWSVNVFTLIDAIHDLEHSQWRKVPVTHGDYCFGSSVANSVGELRFNVPRVCNQLDCRIRLVFLHSWNTSYIGNTACSLHRRANETHNGMHLANLTVKGQDNANGATIPVESTFDGVVKEGLHSVKCANLVDDRLSCMIALNVNAVVVV